MKFISAFILNILISSGSSNNGDMRDFCSEYRNGIESATKKYKLIRNDIHDFSDKFGTDSFIIASVVFPEMIRYQVYRDYMETSMNEIFYIEGGSAVSDFSIGIFQIKPSFAEALELAVSKNTTLKKYSFLLKYRSQEVKEQRKERLERLGSDKWQILYLNCFFTYLDKKFESEKFKGTDEKLRFFATCYNHGLNFSSAEIKKWMNIKTFPNGPGSFRRNYCYADISLLFYKMISNV